VGGSFEATCDGPGDTVSTVDVIGFIVCEESSEDSDVPRAGGELLNPSTGDHIYNIIVPPSTTIFDDVAGFQRTSCADYGAYHFMAFSFDIVPKPMYFTVISTDTEDGGCPSNPDEIVRDLARGRRRRPPPAAAALLGGHVDTAGAVRRTADDLSDLDVVARALLQSSSSAPFRASPPVRLRTSVRRRSTPCRTMSGGESFLVSAYWLNEDGTPASSARRAVSTSTSANGVPPTEARDRRRRRASVRLHWRTLRGHGVQLSVDDGQQRDRCAVRSRGRLLRRGRVPAGNTTADASQNVTCEYERSTAHGANGSAAAATGNTSLTPSAWIPDGTVVPLEADETVSAGTGSRYVFPVGGGRNADSVRDGDHVRPRTVDAVYDAAPHGVRGVGIPDGTTWHVTVGGTEYDGPPRAGRTRRRRLFSFETPVTDAPRPPLDMRSSTSTPSPLSVSGPDGDGHVRDRAPAHGWHIGSGDELDDRAERYCVSGNGHGRNPFRPGFDGTPLALGERSVHGAAGAVLPRRPRAAVRRRR
jgi:hypothetical protein